MQGIIFKPMAQVDGPSGKEVAQVEASCSNPWLRILDNTNSSNTIVILFTVTSMHKGTQTNIEDDHASMAQVPTQDTPPQYAWTLYDDFLISLYFQVHECSTLVPDSSLSIGMQRA